MQKRSKFHFLTCFFFFFPFITSICFSASFNLELEQLLYRQKTGFMSDLKNQIMPNQIAVFGKGDTSRIIAAGGTIQTSANNYFTAFVPISSLESLHSDTNLEFLRFGQKVQTYLDNSRAMVSANVTYQKGYKGNNVIIGIIDTGIDLTHPDFTTENGLSRVIYLWDQTVLNPKIKPAGFDYGREWTKSEIDQNLSTELDYDYHGTHVTGIAAGNGTGDPKYRGISPEANIIFVKLDFSNPITGIIDAIHYIMQKSKSYGKPCVINLSLGTQSGSHTAADPFNLAIDNLVNQYGEAGNLIVWAAGNDGEYPVHTTNLTKGTPTEIGLNYTASPAYLDFWFNYTNMQIAVIDPAGATNMTFTPITGSGSYQNSQLQLVWGDTAGEKWVSFSVSNNQMGTWKFVFQGTASTNVLIDGYIINYDNLYNNAFSNAVYSGTLSSMACQKKSITVGAVISKTNYINIYGQMETISEGDIGQIAPFSSLGPARDGQYKPDVCAPGSVIVSAKAKEISSKTIPGSYKINSLYWVEEGTSMAAPAVTGVIAQLLEKDPGLTYSDIQNFFSSYSGLTAYKIDRFWDNTYGYGVADLSALLTTDGKTKSFTVNIFNNILSLTGNKDNKFILLFRSNSSSINKSVSLKIYDRQGGMVRDLGKKSVDQIEVIQYVWDGKNQSGQNCVPGLYFADVTADTADSRYPVLIIR